MATEDSNLPAIIDQARFRLAEARTSAEALEARAMGEAAWHVSKLVKASHEVQADCLRIIDRAEKLVGVNLNEQEKHKGGRPKQNLSENATGFLGFVDPPTLTELGITRDQSAYFQHRARTPDDVVDRAIDQPVEQGRSPLKRDIKAAVKGFIGQSKPWRRKPRRLKGRFSQFVRDERESDLVQQYNLKEFGGWMVAATHRFWNKIPWDHELVPDQPAEEPVIRAITVSRDWGTKDVIIRIPGEIGNHVFDYTQTMVEFRLIKFEMPEKD